MAAYSEISLVKIQLQISTIKFFDIKNSYPGNEEKLKRLAISGLVLLT